MAKKKSNSENLMEMAKQTEDDFLFREFDAKYPNIQNDGIKLTVKHRLFLENWIATGNIAASIRKAGYTTKSPSVYGSQLLKDPRSKMYVLKRREMLEKEQNQAIASTNEVLSYLTRVMRGEEKDAFGLDVGIQDRTKAALELNRVLGPTETKEERVIIIDGITKNNK